MKDACKKALRTKLISAPGLVDFGIGSCIPYLTLHYETSVNWHTKCDQVKEVENVRIPVSAWRFKMKGLPKYI